MANFLTEPYSTFSKRLTDWLNTSGGEVTNLTLDLLNRAQQWLCLYRAWDGLTVRTQLTLSDKDITLPSTFSGACVAVYTDSNGDGKPDKYYYRDGEVGSGYRAQNTFAKATGHSWKFTFFAAPASNPVVVFPVPLDDFAGTGTEYSFFPTNLLLATAKKLHIEESDLVGPEYESILRAHDELLREFEHSHQHQNIEWRMRQLDTDGNEVGNEGYDLNGGSETAFLDEYDSSYDMG
jgi:hypothetical protein